MENIFKIISVQEFRKTKDVIFNNVPIVDNLTAITRVEHGPNAKSPGSLGNIERPWYMHPGQTDHLLVLHGTRCVDLYTKETGKIVKFDVTPDEIRKNGEIICKGPAILMWPTFVFHRVESGPEGSMSLNFAVRGENFDIKTNFNIYDLDLNTGKYQVIREGHKDQKKL